MTEIVSAIAAVLAAVFAWSTKKSAESISRSRNTLDLLLVVETRIAALSRYETKISRAELLTAAGSKTPYSEGALAYQQALNILDILAFAIETGSVDAAQANRYLRYLGASAPVLKTFIAEYRRECGDKDVYDALETLLTKLENPTPKWLRP